MPRFLESTLHQCILRSCRRAHVRTRHSTRKQKLKRQTESDVTPTTRCAHDRHKPQQKWSAPPFLAGNQGSRAAQARDGVCDWWYGSDEPTSERAPADRGRHPVDWLKQDVPEDMGRGHRNPDRGAAMWFHSLKLLLARTRPLCIQSSGRLAFALSFHYARLAPCTDLSTCTAAIQEGLTIAS